MAGYRNALAHHNLPFRNEWLVHSDFQTESALNALHARLVLPEPPTPIFALRCTDAFTSMQELKRRGHRMPQGVAVVGFGDEFRSSMIEPGLATVDLHSYRIGQQAAHLFLEQVQEKDNFRPHALPSSSPAT